MSTNLKIQPMYPGIEGPSEDQIADLIAHFNGNVSEEE